MVWMEVQISSGVFMAATFTKVTPASLSCWSCSSENADLGP